MDGLYGPERTGFKIISFLSMTFILSDPQSANSQTRNSRRGFIPGGASNLIVQLRLPVCAAGYPGVVSSNSEYCDNLIGFEEQSEI